VGDILGDAVGGSDGFVEVGTIVGRKEGASVGDVGFQVGRRELGFTVGF